VSFGYIYTVELS